MSELNIIGAPGSPYVWVTRIAAAEKAVPYTLIPTMPHTPEVNAIHPFGKIPVMRHGEITLCESRAICSYIDRAFEGSPLVPRDACEAARVEQWISLINTHINPVFIDQYLGAYFFPGTPDGSVDRGIVDAALPSMRAQAALLGRAVAQTGYLAGDSFTLADMYLLPLLFYMNKMPESRVMLAETRDLAAYFNRHIERASVAQTIPASFPAPIAQALAIVQAA